MRSKDFSIGVLSITATILFVGLVIIHATSTPTVYGFGQRDRGGDYIVATGQLDEAVELLYVLDAAVPSLAVYHFDPNRGGLFLDDLSDLRALVAREAGAGAAPPPRGRKRR